MERIRKFSEQHYKEILYQGVLLIVLFVFFSHGQDGFESMSLESILLPYKFAFFANYMFAGLVINYVLLPGFYYRKRPFWFFVFVALVVLIAILIDEIVLEQIYFPDTRGKYFPGIAFTLIETLPIILIMLAFKFAWDFNKKQSEIDSLKALVKENELQFLKSQINPHFLFNNLNNLYSYALVNSPKTPSIILELSSVLRHLLYDCSQDEVLLSKEIEQLKNFTSLYELQIEHRGEVDFSTDMGETDYFIAPLILMVFIENAFKHSSHSQSDKIKIDIDIRMNEEGTLVFVCKNNYLPAVKDKDIAKGIGLENVRKRLNLLYPKTHQLEIRDDGRFYEVTLRLELKTTD